MTRILTALFAVALLIGNAASAGESDLSWAASEADAALVKTLLDAGADVNEKSGKHNQTALHRARSVEVAKLLIANGADINAKDKTGETPLDVMKGYSNYGSPYEDIAKFLIKVGMQAKTAPKAAEPKNKCRELLDEAGKNIGKALGFMTKDQSATVEMMITALNSANGKVAVAKSHCN